MLSRVARQAIHHNPWQPSLTFACRYAHKKAKKQQPYGSEASGSTWISPSYRNEAVTGKGKGRQQDSTFLPRTGRPDRPAAPFGNRSRTGNFSRSPKANRSDVIQRTPSAHQVRNVLARRLQEWAGSYETRDRLELYGLEDAEIEETVRSWQNAEMYALKTLDAKALKTTSPHTDTGEDILPGWNMQRLQRAMTTRPDWTKEIDTAILRKYLAYITTHASIEPSTASRIQEILQVTDVTSAASGYTSAREMRRHFHLHIGPTNSGKTYSALKALAVAKTGTYAGPLRLLAHEVWDRMNRGTVGGMKEGEGRACNLITGEERRIVDPIAGLTSCTVEMISLTEVMDVAVIDEIQMIGDLQRGGAWTTAVMGLLAKEIHLCGEETVVDVIQRMVTAMGDRLTIHRYERLTPLQVADESLHGHLKKIQDGDCIVSFSRSGIFNLKKNIEATVGKRCAVVYGALPPETRSEQARLFNEVGNGVNVMVASDAVGMGLNL
jgi:ATP-dependent RNA helicase SUPV3L1/SUV3